MRIISLQRLFCLAILGNCLFKLLLLLLCCFTRIFIIKYNWFPYEREIHQAHMWFMECSWTVANSVREDELVTGFCIGHSTLYGTVD